MNAICVYFYDGCDLRLRVCLYRHTRTGIARGASPLVCEPVFGRLAAAACRKSIPSEWPHVLLSCKRGTSILVATPKGVASHPRYLITRVARFFTRFARFTLCCCSRRPGGGGRSNNIFRSGVLCFYENYKNIKQFPP